MWRFAASPEGRLGVTLLALTLGLTLLAGSGRPLTNVDIVRMTAAGVPDEEIIRAIRSARDTRFDLEAEIVEELGRAGVAPGVIEAMKQAQPEEPRPPAPSSEPAPASSLSILFSGKATEGKRPGAIISAKDMKGRQTSLAFFVICVEPTHVPDSWDARSPLGGRFPRHRALWVHEASHPVPGPERLALINIELPERHEIGIESGRHVLELGVAVHTEELGWFPLASTIARVETAPERALEILVRVQTEEAGPEAILAGRAPRYECEILRIGRAGTLRGDAP